MPGAVDQQWPGVDAAVALESGEELVAGRRPVEEAFAARRTAHRLYVVPQRRAPLEALVLHATTLRIPVVEIEGGTMTALAGFDGHQGVALAVAPRVWATLDDVLARAAERGERPFVLVLDSLEDPHNLGSLMRTAEAAGVHGVCFPTHHAVPLTPSAVKASAGAVEHLLLVPVDDLGGLLVDLRGRGLRLVGADAGATLTYRDADLRGPLAMVVGSEGRGLSGPVRRRLDLTVRIPMHGRVASLNAAVAGSVLLLEVATQRGLPDVPHEPELPEQAEAAAEPEAPPTVAAPAASEPKPRVRRPKPAATKAAAATKAPAAATKGRASAKSSSAAKPAHAAVTPPTPPPAPAHAPRVRRLKAAAAEVAPIMPQAEPSPPKVVARKAPVRRSKPAAAKAAPAPGAASAGKALPSPGAPSHSPAAKPPRRAAKGPAAT